MREARRPAVVARSILPALFMVLSFGAAWAGSPATGDSGRTVTSEILGVGIGAKLEQAASRLDRLGTAAGRDTRSGGRKVAWTLKSTDYHTVALKTDRRGRVVWISGFVRAGHRPAFEDLGDPADADRLTDVQAIWNVSPRRGDAYRLVAKGRGGQASVVYLLGR